MTGVIQKKERFTESIDANLEDINKLYKLSILYNLKMFIEKKIFKDYKEKEFLKDPTYKNLIKTVKCKYSSSETLGLNKTDFAVYTIDNIKINIKNIVRSKGQNTVSDANDELYALCRKYDRSGEPKVMPAFEKVMDAYWSYLDF